MHNNYVHNTYVEAIFRFRGSIALIGLAFTVVAAIGLSNLRINAHYTNFFDPDDPSLLAHLELETIYASTENIAFVVIPRQGTVFTSEGLRAIEWLTNNSLEQPYTASAKSIANYNEVITKNDEITTRQLYRGESTDLLHLKEHVLNEPELLYSLVSTDGKLAVVDVSMAIPIGDKDAVKTAAKAAIQLAKQAEETFPSIKVELTGHVMLNHELNTLSVKDGITLIPLALLIILGLLAVFLKSISTVVLALLVIILSTLVAFGVGGWLHIELNPINIIAGVIILTVAVADCVHIFNDHIREINRGTDKTAAALASLSRNFYPTLLTTLTSATGFLSLNFSDAPPFRSLGSITALGVISAWLIIYSILPWILSQYQVTPVFIQSLDRVEQSYIDNIPRILTLPTMIIVGILIIAVSSQNSRNVLDDNLVNYIDESVPFRQTIDKVSNKITGFDRLGWSFATTEPGGINNPQYLQQLSAFTSYLRSLPETVAVSSYSDLMARINQVMHHDNEEYYRVPQSRELAAQYFLLYELSLKNSNRNDIVSHEKNATRVYATFKASKSREFMLMHQQIQEWLKKNTPLLKHPGSGVSLMYNDIGLRNIDSMMKGNIIMVITVTALLCISFRSVKVGLITLLPNSVPALVVFGLWGIFVSQVNLAVAVIFCVTLGIVVDDTIHFVWKYQQARREGKNSKTAVDIAIRKSIPAITITTIVLCSGFSILSFSPLSVNYIMGVMISLTIATAWLFDIFILPTLLQWADR